MAETHQSLVLLGATGSIGQSTVDLVRRDPGAFRIVAATARTNAGELAKLAEEFQIPRLALADPGAARKFREEFPRLADRLVDAPLDSIEELLTASPDAMVVNGLVGAIGLRPTVQSLQLGHDVALANKEALVVGGPLVLDAARRGGARLWPVDSEHSAIAQCLRGNPEEEIRKLWLTASGGPFRDRDPGTFGDVALDEVLAHPNWDMGAKISVDSATMMNKGLEVIEAMILFGTPLANVGVVIHRQSIVHSMVEFIDGAFLAQLGAPDMRVPILYALSRGRHRETDVANLDPLSMGRLDFEEPDLRRYPCLSLARRAAEAGEGAPIVLNAANEEAVAGLLRSELSFGELPAVIETCLESLPLAGVDSVDAALDRDRETRARARELVAQRTRTRS